MEIGSRKHIVAERYFETGVAESLSNLFVSNYKKFKVLSLYSDLSKRLIAYKILHQSDDSTDPWLNQGFKELLTVDFNPEFNIIPNQFSSNNISFLPGFEFQVQGNKKIANTHFIYGLAKYNELRLESVKVYLFKGDEILNVLIFKDKSLVFANAFECKNETEILYFVLSALEASDCTQGETNVFLDYNLGTNESTSSFLSPYFNTVTNLKFDHEDLDEEILNLPELLFFNYAMSLCV